MQCGRIVLFIFPCVNRTWRCDVVMFTGYLALIPRFTCHLIYDLVALTIRLVFSSRCVVSFMSLVVVSREFHRTTLSRAIARHWWSDAALPANKVVFFFCQPYKNSLKLNLEKVASGPLAFPPPVPASVVSSHQVIEKEQTMQSECKGKAIFVTKPHHPVTCSFIDSHCSFSDVLKRAYNH